MIFLRLAGILDLLRMRSEPGQRCCCKGCRGHSEKIPSRKPLRTRPMICATLRDLICGFGIAADPGFVNFLHHVVPFLGVLLLWAAKRMLYRSYLRACT